MQKPGEILTAQVDGVARKEELRTLKDDVIELLDTGQTTLEEGFSILLAE